jgi:hypothetical protein
MRRLAMGKIKTSFAACGLVSMVAGFLLLTPGCGKDYSKINPVQASAVTTPLPCAPQKPTTGIFHNFEASFSPWGGSDIWTNTSALNYATRSSTQVYEGCYSWWLTTSITKDATWGPWAGISGSFNGITDFSGGGYTSVSFWYNLDKPQSLRFYVDEGTDIPKSDGADGEEYHFDIFTQPGSYNPAKLTVFYADASWHQMVIPLTSFSYDPSNITGDHHLDLKNISQMWMDWTTSPMTPVSNGNLYIDYLGFQ